MTYSHTVLGSGGYIGRRLAAELSRINEDVWSPVRGSKEIFTRPLGVVYYCVGLTSDFLLRPYDTVQAHVSYLAQILEYAQFEHIVYLSSTRIYDGLEAEVCSGDTPLSFRPNYPRHLYDLSKVLGENLCLTTSAERCSIARISSVFDTQKGSPGFLSELIQRVKHEREFTLDSMSGYCRDYITLDDAVASLLALGKERVCEIVNVASGVNTYNGEIADALRPLGISISFRSEGSRMKLPRCDIRNLLDIGVYPANTLQTLIEYVQKPVI